MDELTALRALPRPLADFRGLLRTEQRGERGKGKGGEVNEKGRRRGAGRRKSGRKAGTGPPID